MRLRLYEMGMEAIAELLLNRFCRLFLNREFYNLVTVSSLLFLQIFKDCVQVIIERFSILFSVFMNFANDFILIHHSFLDGFVSHQLIGSADNG